MFVLHIHEARLCVRGEPLHRIIQTSVCGKMHRGLALVIQNVGVAARRAKLVADAGVRSKENRGLAMPVPHIYVCSGIQQQLHDACGAVEDSEVHGAHAMCIHGIGIRSSSQQARHDIAVLSFHSG